MAEPVKDEDVKKAMALISSCLDLNKVAPLVGMSAMLSLIFTAAKEYGMDLHRLFAIIEKAWNEVEI